MEAEPSRCTTCQRLIYQTGGGHSENCPQRPVFAKGETTFGGGVYEPLHRPLTGGLPPPIDG